MNMNIIQLMNLGVYPESPRWYVYSNFIALTTPAKLFQARQGGAYASIGRKCRFVLFRRDGYPSVQLYIFEFDEYGKPTTSYQRVNWQPFEPDFIPTFSALLAVLVQAYQRLLAILASPY